MHAMHFWFVLTFPIFYTGNGLMREVRVLMYYSAPVSKAAYNDVPHFHNLRLGIPDVPSQANLFINKH